jgi:hypothetical protein
MKNYNLTIVEKELSIDAIEFYKKHLSEQGLKDNHELIIKFDKIITKLRENNNA